MKTLKYLLPIGIAAGAGLAVGVLTAPRSGRKTRERIMDEIDETKKAIEDAANKKLKEAKDRLNKSIKAHQSNGKEANSKLKEAVKS
jgi:gas vesicle protein